MNLTLTRNRFDDTGVYGELVSDDGSFSCVTLEHSYQSDDGDWLPKVPPGVYLCVRGQHQLHSGPIETFEVTGVEGHQGILIHPGNAEGDSEGCILVGEARVSDMITNSRVTFAKFMELQEGLDEFQLVVE